MRFLCNGFDSCRFTDKKVYDSFALDYNNDDSDTSMIRGSSVKPAQNTTSTLRFCNENIKSI